jgi:hypothetical protein
LSLFIRQGACAIAKTKVEEDRHRSLPAQLVVCLIIAMSLWSRDSMRDVLKNLIDGLSEAWVKIGKYWRFPCKSAITQARQRRLSRGDETVVSSVGATNGKSAKR